MVVDNKATLTYVQVQKEDLAIFRIVPKDGPVPEYKSGQFITIGMHVPSENKIIRRAYSIASNPENRKYVELYIRWVRKPLPGRLTTQLFSAKEGDEIVWVKPTGLFTLDDKKPNGEKDDRRIVCLGGGTGLAPFVSLAQSLHATGSKRELIVLHGASYVDELGYRELLTDLENESLDRGKDKWNFRYRAAISRPQEWFNRSWSGQTGRVETFLRTKDGEPSPLEKLVGDKITAENTVFFICGWQGTIDGCMDYLTPKGFVSERNKRPDKSFEIKYESYG
ncbi:MAG TPA: FAD-binding oxidoreductase [Nitrosopumilaceae archaeon]|nr:FAD-binding oxidoreductase [Nitrosopumilaceae archaeon]